MTPEALAEILETAPTVAEARGRIRPFARTPGFSQAFFARLATRINESPEAGFALAGRWRLVVEFGDDVALAYRAKGALERLQGRWLESVVSFREAGRRAACPADSFAHQVGAIDSLSQVGKVEEAIRLDRRIVRGLEREGQDALAARACLNVAAAYLWADRYRDAERWLLRARDGLDEAGMAPESAGARMSLSTCAFHLGEPQRARQLAEEAQQRYEALGQTHMARLCDVNIAQCGLLTGRPDDALDLLLAIRPEFVGSAIDQARIEEFLGDAYGRLNMPEESAHAYRVALEMPAIRSIPINQANCHLGLAWAALAVGDGREARRASRRAEDDYRKFGNAIWTAVAQTTQARALLLLGRPAAARELALTATEVLRQTRARFALAEALVTLAEAKLQAGENIETELRGAERLIRLGGREALRWKVHALRAQTATGETRLRQYRRMRDAILRARMLVNSTVGRASFLQDKSAALGEYLAELLARPTSRRVGEALEMIRATRSAALLDETLAARPDALDPTTREKLESLRTELGQDIGEGSPGAPIRRSGSGSSQVYRRWIELTRRLQQVGQAKSGRQELALVLALASDRAYVLTPQRVTDLGRQAALREKLRWLRFELFAPLADREADPTALLERLGELRKDLAAVFPPQDGYPRIAPMGDLWGVPWAAVASISDPAAEPVLALSPEFGVDAHAARLPAEPRVVIWAGQTDLLPQIASEVDSIRAVFPTASVLTSGQEIRRFMENGSADYLHVACHARLDSNKPMFSFLDFPDGPLYAVEVARSGMQVGIASLSACDTGNLSTLHHHEPEGIVRAFLARRAAAVVASQWALDDEMAAIFAGKFAHCLANGDVAGSATAAARLSLQKLRPHPYFWAAMVLFGGYR